MKVALIRDEIVEWRTVPEQEPPNSIRWRDRSLLACLEEDRAEALMLIGLSDGLELACAVRRSETHRNLPIAVLSQEPPDTAHPSWQGQLDSEYLSGPLGAPRQATSRARRVHIDRRAREVWVDGRYESCSPMEFRLLLFFLQYPQIVFSREELVRRVRLEDSPVDARIIDVFMRRLRRKVEVFAESPRNLKTVTKLGYLFEYNGDVFIDVETNSPFESFIYPPTVTFCS